jgi:hypothetical protein
LHFTILRWNTDKSLSWDVSKERYTNNTLTNIPLTCKDTRLMSWVYCRCCGCEFALLINSTEVVSIKHILRIECYIKFKPS